MVAQCGVVCVRPKSVSLAQQPASVPLTYIYIYIYILILVTSTKNGSKFDYTSLSVTPPGAISVASSDCTEESLDDEQNGTGCPPGIT